MIEFDVDRLRTLGLTPALARSAAEAASAHERARPGAPPLGPVRLTEVHRQTVRLHDGEDELSARVLPRLIRTLADESTALAVGDWVLAATATEGPIWVHERLRPFSHIDRRDAEGSRHPVVSNVDVALLVMGLDDDFSPRRLERYLALVLSGTSGPVVPAVVLTKVDVIGRRPGLLAARIEALRGRVPASIDLFAIDGNDPYTVWQLAGHLGAGRTLVLLGSSGAGKSTLTNTLVGRAVQDTGEVRAHDSRGRHTTTSRSLHRLPGGACVIDTPGLRTLRADVDESTLAAAFHDIRSLAGECRFRNCRHRDEPGCAVRGEVPPDRVDNFHKLLCEARRGAPGGAERRQQQAIGRSQGRAVARSRGCEGHERLRQKRGAGEPG